MREAVATRVVDAEVVVIGQPDVVLAVGLCAVHGRVRQVGDRPLHHLVGLGVQAIQLGDAAQARPRASPNVVLRVDAQPPDRAGRVLAHQAIKPEPPSHGVEARDAAVVIVGPPDLVLIVDDDAVGPTRDDRHVPPLDRVAGAIPLAEPAGAQERQPEVAAGIEDLGVAAECGALAHLVAVDEAGLWIEASDSIARVPDGAVGGIDGNAVPATVAFIRRGLCGARVEADDAA